MDGGYTLIEGDCRAALRSLAAGSIQCCVTSPPYWNGAESSEQYTSRLVETFRAVRDVCRPGASLWLILGDDPRTGETGMPERAGRALELDGWLPHHCIQWIDGFDLLHLVLTFTNGAPNEAARFERIAPGPWRHRAEPMKTEYRWSVLPESLAGECVEGGSLEGDMVLDPFCGLASVGVAALKRKRRFTGIEIERRTLQLAWERLRSAADL